jgi:hypothetical protein
LVVMILAVMWVLVLVPPLLRSRTDGRPSASISSFRRQLTTLGRAAPAHYARVGRPMARPAAYRPQGYGQRRPGYGYGQPQGYGYGPSRMSQRAAAKRRRQSVLLTLAGLAFFTGVLAFGLGIKSMVWVHLGVDAAVLVYLYLLISMRKAEEMRSYRGSYYEAA